MKTIVINNSPCDIFNIFLVKVPIVKVVWDTDSMVFRKGEQHSSVLLHTFSTTLYHAQCLYVHMQIGAYGVDLPAQTVDFLMCACNASGAMYFIAPRKSTVWVRARIVFASLLVFANALARRHGLKHRSAFRILTQNQADAFALCAQSALHLLVRPAGLEPATRWLRASCSTD